MSSNQSVHALVCEAARILGWCPPVACIDRDAWRVVTQHELLVDIEYDAEHERVLLAGSFGPIAHDARLRMYPILLRYNRLWLDTGGLRMALDGLHDETVLMLDLSVSALQASRFATLLHNFGDIQDAWRQVLLSADGHEAVGNADLTRQGLGLEPHTLLGLV